MLWCLDAYWVFDCFFSNSTKLEGTIIIIVILECNPSDDGFEYSTNDSSTALKAHTKRSNKGTLNNNMTLIKQWKGYDANAIKSTLSSWQRWNACSCASNKCWRSTIGVYLSHMHLIRDMNTIDFEFLDIHLAYSNEWVRCKSKHQQHIRIHVCLH